MPKGEGVFADSPALSCGSGTVSSLTGVISSAFFPCFPGQTAAQVPQPVKSEGDSVIANKRSSTPNMGMVFSPSGAFARTSSSKTAGRITPWGQKKEQRAHWIQFSGFHTGISVATALLSWAVLPGGVYPSA